MNEPVSTNDVLSALGVDINTEPEQDPAPDTTETDPTPTETNAAPQQTEGEPKGETDPPPIDAGTEKANQAFAHMRTQNKQYKSFVENLGKVLGIQSNDPNEIFSQVETVLTAQQAKEQNVPPEMLTRMRQLEQQNEQFTQSQLKQKALLGFDAVKKQYGLKDADVSEFVQKLADEGLNPFEKDIDLMTTYKTMYFEKLVEQAKKDGIAEEQARLEKINKHSTSPSAHSGGAANTGTEKIDTVAGLTAFLSQK